MKILIFTFIWSLISLATEEAGISWNDDVSVVVKNSTNTLLPLKKPPHVSPFCSSVARVSEPSENVGIPNMHEVLSTEDIGVPVLRSNSPFWPEHVEDVIDQGVGKIIVYKNFKKTSQKQDLENLYRENGYEGELIFLDMPWAPDPKTQEFDFVSSCKLTVKAMLAIRESKVPVLFHCTVGEDRTGMLAGLLRIVYDGWTLNEAFSNEMCARGYEAGNPQKTEEFVVSAVRRALTPLFLKMVTALKNNGGEISEKMCDSLPSEYIDGLTPADLTCDPVNDKSKLCTGDEH